MENIIQYSYGFLDGVKKGKKQHYRLEHNITGGIAKAIGHFFPFCQHVPQPCIIYYYFCRPANSSRSAMALVFSVRCCVA